MKRVQHTARDQLLLLFNGLTLSVHEVCVCVRWGGGGIKWGMRSLCCVSMRDSLWVCEIKGGGCISDDFIRYVLIYALTCPFSCVCVCVC